MSGRSGRTSVIERAADDATRIADAAGVQVRLLDGMADLTAAMEAFRSIWGFPDGQAPISAELLRAFAYAGGYVAGAYAGDRLIGASAGFLAGRQDAVHLHSHISGVVPTWQGRNVGLALKQHQRAWAVERGIDVIEWTFDPLVRRNAYFNLVKLGAEAVDFEPNFYGEMHDAINAGDETDRAVVHWFLRSDAAQAAVRGELRRDDAAGRTVLRADQEGGPVVAQSDHGVLRAWVPEDAARMRRRDPHLARQWRTALRTTFGAAVAADYVAVSMSRDGWYTLVKAGPARS